VTRDGLLGWGPWQYADPNQALMATQPDMMDGWYDWSTPDGDTLDALRWKGPPEPSDHRGGATGGAALRLRDPHPGRPAAGGRRRRIGG